MVQLRPTLSSTYVTTSSKLNKNFDFKSLPKKPHGMNINNLEKKIQCEIKGNYRRCEDGQCIPEIDLCQEQLMNQNTILIMIVVGLAVVIFLIVLYCFQQRQRTRHGHYRSSNAETEEESADRVSLFLPPPTYEEVITTNLYPPTPEMQLRQNRINSFDEPCPITPPPNYNTALAILARSHESILHTKLTAPRPPRQQAGTRLTRRSISVDNITNVNRTQSQTQNLTPNIEISEHLEDDVFLRTSDDSNTAKQSR